MSLSAFLLRSCSQRLISKLELTSKVTQETLKRNHYYIMLNNPETYRQWENVERRVYLLRATTVNSIFIVITVVAIGCLKYRSYWKLWLLLLTLPVILGILSAITWHRARLRSDDALDQLYNIAIAKNQETKE